MTINNTFLAAIFIASVFCSNYSAAQSNEIPFTQQDRDRLIRLEVKVEAIDKRIDDLRIDFNQHFDDLLTIMLWGFGILFGGMGLLIGFVLWDRRTTLAPVIKENQAMKRVFLKLSQNNLDVKKALKEEGIL